MRSILRSVLAAVACFAVASVVLMVIESVDGRFLYPELGKAAERLTDKDVIGQVLATAPIGAFLVVITGWVLGAVAGGWVAAWTGRRAPVGHALTIGGLLRLAGVANNVMVPPPIWFWVASLVVLFPAAYAGGRLAPRPR
jgi:hypothetical protein